jgi:hypothetical protein
MDIATDDYQQRRHVFDLCRWINEKLASMKELPNFDTIYLERTGDMKRLIEEVIPIACLGLYFFKPADDVYIKCLKHVEGKPQYDAELEVIGSNPLKIKVEATTNETDESTMRRQATSRNGFVHMTGRLKRDERDRRNIISEPDMVDAGQENEEWVELAFTRYKNKIDHGYDGDTAILIWLDTYRPLPLYSRAELVQRTRQHILKERPSIFGAFYGYNGEYVVDGVRISRSKSA